MENIYRVNCSEKMKVSEIFDKFRAELCPSSLERMPQTYDEIKSILGIHDEDSEQLLEESISLNNLAQPDDIPVVDFHLHELYAKTAAKQVEIPAAAMRLNCVKQHHEKMMNRSSTSVPGKYNRYRYIAPNYDNSEGICDLKAMEDILITVRVYEPFIYKRGASSNRKPRLSQEFFVLGRQRLTELRDKIYCQCQFGPFHDISNDYEQIMSDEISDLQPSTSKSDDIATFFISDIFYNDCRSSQADYSAEIREWMSRQSDIQPVQVKSMDDTKFEDLEIRLGFPQLFRHYINCEHVLTFTDMRLLAPDDSLKSIDYPMLRCVSTTKTCICIVCGVIEATFIVRNSDMHIQNPTFLCRNCLVSFHYVDGEKVGEFQLFRYYGNRPILNKVQK